MPGGGSDHLLVIFLLGVIVGMVVHTGLTKK